METYIKKYADIDLKDIEEVGYKNASIGKMMKHLAPHGVLIPTGFAIVKAAYQYFLVSNKLDIQLKSLMVTLDTEGFSNLSEISSQARKLIMDGKMPADLGLQIIDAYDYLFDAFNVSVAIRSSAVSVQIADAAAVGLNDSFFNVQGHGALLYGIRQCFASLYTERAVKYAINKGYNPNEAAMAIGIQQMVRVSDGASGVGYTTDPRTNNDEMIYLKAIWGLGELINQETIEPDEYAVFKPSLQMVSMLLVEKELGSKLKMMVYADEDDESNQTILKDTPIALQQQFVLEEKQIQRLADWAILLDNLYQRPICFEWAKDGHDHQLYLIQVSPCTLLKPTLQKTVLKTL